MKTETISNVIHCDRCHPRGNDAYPHRLGRFFFGKRIKLIGKLRVGIQNGWWIGKKYHLCRSCSKVMGMKSRAGQSNVIQLQEAAQL